MTLSQSIYAAGSQGCDDIDDFDTDALQRDTRLLPTNRNGADSGPAKSTHLCLRAKNGQRLASEGQQPRDVSRPYHAWELR